MYVSKIILHEFRCHKDLQCNFDKGINVIIGGNASGKTSIVEAIYLLGIGKSFKTSKNDEMIKIGSEYSIVKGIASNDIENTMITIGMDKSKKKIKHDNKTLKSTSEHIGFLNVIAFSPDDKEIITGMPSVRRKFVDEYLCQIDKIYLNNLINFRKALKIRNEFLKKKRSGYKFSLVELQVIDEQFIKYAREIIKKRKHFIKSLCIYVNMYGKMITGGIENYTLEYNANRDENEIETELKKSYSYDVENCRTSIGPHLDDIKVYSNGQVVSIYGSQGQIKSSALCLKLGLVKLFEEEGKKPIVILDDVFSELDKKRQNYLMESLKDIEQVFITTTCVSQIDKNMINNNNIYNIEGKEQHYE